MDIEQPDLNEMTQEQVAGYVAVMDRISAGGVVYIKQWLRWRNPADGIELTFNGYPVPTGRRQIFWQCAPVRTNFWQTGWLVEPRT
jgi:hypothetical protein